jgi:hypothetical protein
MRVVSVVSYNEHTAAIVALSDDPLPLVSSALLSSSSASENSEARYVNDFRNLYSDGSFADVHILVDGRSIPAHKAILSCRCQHFRSMFRSGMRESVEKEIVIPNARYRIFSALLEFIYTNKVQTLTGEEAIELYLLSDLYQMDDLTRLCKEVVIRSLTVHTSPLMLVQASNFGITVLHDICLNYMVRHFDVVSKTVEFSEMSKDLVLEVLQKRTPLVFFDSSKDGGRYMS